MKNDCLLGDKLLAIDMLVSLSLKERLPSSWGILDISQGFVFISTEGRGVMEGG